MAAKDFGTKQKGGGVKTYAKFKRKRKRQG